jgi:hypothetical protein
MSQPMYSQASSSSSVIPTSNPPPVQRATTLRRGKTLTRPERQVAQAPLITPPAPLAPGAKPSFPYAAPVSANTNTVSWDWWVITSLVCTFWAPVPVLEACGFKDSAVRQAWREKVTLVTICIILGGAVAFLTMGLEKALCPQSASKEASELRSLGSTPGELRPACIDREGERASTKGILLDGKREGSTLRNGRENGLERKEEARRPRGRRSRFVHLKHELTHTLNRLCS